ncbi:cyclohexanone monooxygenase [Boletus edulis BED1]|uniref:Cyclohexanone monooxygenase n=1 Tax=Boletus edulis BED1 TaxID=1328754 RepID=A0AAD4GGK1_BOLED|nr:cyclohexanone monooxygenase [Boletus edulis BED1]
MSPYPTMSEERFDAVIIGGGFSGVYQLIQLRRLGMKCKLVEAGSDLGGTWYWNRYPGARVDTAIPAYEFSLPELWEGWTWTEKYPGQKEIHAYFAYVSDKLDLRKDCRFDSTVKSAHWDDQLHLWHISCDEKENPYNVSARHLIACTGFASKPYTPDLKGLNTFQGVSTHTGRWPELGIETTGERVAVIGTGASGVQVIQEIASHVKHLTVFQRTPNLAIPMRQHELTKQVQDQYKFTYGPAYEKLRTTFAGLQCDFIYRPMQNDTLEQRQAVFEKLWEQGGFSFWLGNYLAMLIDQGANDEIYAFWQKKVSERVKDPRKQELLAPSVPPHPFGCKNPSLEQTYYDVFNQDNIDIVNLRETPIVEEYEVDVLIFATGWDSHTGRIMDIDLRGLDGESIQDHWKDRLKTYLGMTVDNFPNLYIVYGPQGPTALCNGPTCAEVQGAWVTSTIDYLRQNNITKFSPTMHATKTYGQHVEELSNATLIPKVDSFWIGANIPGKNVGAYNYAGGLPTYRQEITDEIAKGYPGFQREALGEEA